ncbi:hypothetical protein Tco_1233284 [Tanacetum coccineum]
MSEVEQDDWSMEFDAEHVHFGQDGLGDFDWSNKDDDTPVSLALMATNSEGNPEEDLKDYAIIDSGCSGSMTGDKDKLSDFKEFKGGQVLDYGYLLYKSRICSSCKLLCSGTLDAKSTI